MAESTAKACLTAFLHEWVPRYGVPLSAVSDNGSSFISGLWKDLHEALGTVVSYTPPLHSQSLGSLERQHLDLKSVRIPSFQVIWPLQWARARPFKSSWRGSGSYPTVPQHQQTLGKRFNHICHQTLQTPPTLVLKTRRKSNWAQLTTDGIQY